MPNPRNQVEFAIQILMPYRVGGKMGEIRITQLQVAAGAENLAQGPPESPLDSSVVEMNWAKSSPFSGALANRGERLTELHFMSIKIAPLDSDAVKESRIRLLPELPFDYPAAVHQGKYFADTSPKKGSRLSSRRWRRVSRQPRDNPLQLNIDFLVLATGYSLGIIGSRFSPGCTRKRIRVKDFSLGRAGRKNHRRTIKDKRHASLVEPYLIAYDAGDAFSKQRRKIMSMSYDGDQSEDRQSEEVQSAYKRDNEVDEETELRTNFGLRHTEEQEQQNETDWSWVLQDKDGDPLSESISSLQTTHGVLENGRTLLFLDASYALCFEFVCVRIGLTAPYPCTFQPY